MDILFYSNVHGSYLYKAIRDNEDNEILRNRLNNLWRRYKPYADHDFVKKFSIEVYQRFWEMLLGCKLLTLGFELEKKSKRKDLGPDLCVLNANEKIWIEATVTMIGDGGDAVPFLEDSYSHAFITPTKEIILRYCAAVEAKRKKFASYLEERVIEPDDKCVIAISSCALPFEYIANPDEIPFAVQAVFPIGDLTYPYNADSETFSDPFLQRREELTKKSGARVPTFAFLVERFKNISGLIFSDERLERFYDLDQTTLSFIHNKKAKCESKKGWLQKGHEWWWDNNQLLHRQI